LAVKALAVPHFAHISESLATGIGFDAASCVLGSLGGDTAVEAGTEASSFTATASKR